MSATLDDLARVRAEISSLNRNGGAQLERLDLRVQALEICVSALAAAVLYMDACKDPNRLGIKDALQQMEQRKFREAVECLRDGEFL